MDVNARNYRGFQSCSKSCQMYDMGEDGTIGHMIQVCEKYDSDRMDMMNLIRTEMGCEINEVIQRTGKE